MKYIAPLLLLYALLSITFTPAPNVVVAMLHLPAF